MLAANCLRMQLEAADRISRVVRTDTDPMAINRST